MKVSDRDVQVLDSIIDFCEITAKENDLHALPWWLDGASKTFRIGQANGLRMAAEYCKSLKKGAGDGDQHD